jgi:N-acetylglucosaminyldiphosphoundecaprenol N-acetyl-beta-D-mannosaminyltransferase
MLLQSQEDPDLRRILEQAALVVPESSGILWASRVIGSPLQQFIPGIDFMLALCGLAQDEQLSVYFLGSAPGVAETAVTALRHRFPRLRVAGTGDGYFKKEDEPAVIAHVRDAKPALLFVGMGMPAQEKWIARHLRTLNVPIVMGVGGSFDVLSGRLRRAPAWMRGAGIEWLYRLAQEPWRWRRIAQLPVFAWKVLQEKRHAS